MNKFVVGDRVIRNCADFDYPFVDTVVRVTATHGEDGLSVGGSVREWDARLFTKVAGEATAPNVSTYTDAELRRLTTLTVQTLNVGECFANSHRDNFGHMKAKFIDARGNYLHQIVSSNGKASDLSNFDQSALRRRVASVVDLTELDPSQDEMAKELDRRRPKGIKNGDSPVFAKMKYSGERVAVLTKSQAEAYSRGRAYPVGVDFTTGTVIVSVESGYIDVVCSNILNAV